MFKITRLTDYALIVLCAMADKPNEIVSSSEIAALVHLQLPTVSKIMKILVKAGLVKSFRGIEGGYCLAKQADNIYLNEVIKFFEGQVKITDCANIANTANTSNILSCEHVINCQMSRPWQKINKAVFTLLEKISIKDMANNQIII